MNETLGQAILNGLGAVVYYLIHFVGFGLGTARDLFELLFAALRNLH